MRVTISDMGPVLLSRLLGLTKVQEGVLNIVFRIADDRQMLLIDMKDLRSMLNRERQKQKDAVARVATGILGSAGRTTANQIVRGLFGTRR